MSTTSVYGDRPTEPQGSDVGGERVRSGLEIEVIDSYSEPNPSGSNPFMNELRAQ